MNLAAKDIRQNVGRFVMTAIGIGLLLMIVLGMSGIYRGMIADALVMVDRIGADLWVVQRGTRGPFAEVSRVPANLELRVRAVPGVASARTFVSHTIQREHLGKPLRVNVNGLAWPEDTGGWVPLIGGRPLGSAHFELIADASLGLRLGERVVLGKETYTVVGIAQGMVSSSGDGMAFVTSQDALAIQFDLPGEAVRLERSARVHRAAGQDLGRVQPLLLERGAGAASGIPALGAPMVSAIIVRLIEGADVGTVRSTLAAWPDVSVHTRDDQETLMIHGMIDKARRQIGLFRVLLVVISTIIMALILYTLTLDKIHDIALLKLMGARNGMIIGLILQQALLLGGLGYLIAYALGGWVFPHFPRRVFIATQDLWGLGVVVVLISFVSSLLGIWKAMRVEPNKVLS